MAQSSITIERIDQLIIEGKSPTIGQHDFMMMVAENLACSLEQIWRVKLADDGSVELSDFTMPKTSKNFITTQRLNEVSQLSDWVRERISVLQICESGTTLEGVGQKVSDKVFYVIE